MMKKYNKPEIVTLALDMVDVIETSAEDFAEQALQGVLGNEAKIMKIEKQVTAMNDEWSW
jgi:hypothetical protein